MPKARGREATKAGRTVPQNTPATDDTEPIWAHAGLQKEVFYACISFFDVHRPTQPVEYIIPPTGHPVRSEEDNNTTRLLDQLALLFSRFKKSRLPLNTATDGLNPSSTGQNVTAAALEMPQGQPWTIHLTKNNGPLEFDGRSDKAVLKKIADWYRGLDAETASLPAKKDKIWGVLTSFWLRRLCHYYDGLRDIKQELMATLSGTGISSDDGTTSNRGLQEAFAKCEDHGRDGILPQNPKCALCLKKEGDLMCDIAHVKVLLAELDSDDTSDVALHAYVDYIWFRDDASWQGRYTKQSSATVSDPKLGRKANHFYHAVKYLSLVATPKSVLERLVRFKKQYPHVNLRFNFVDAAPVEPIRAQGIINALETTWKAEMRESCKEFKADLKKTRISLEREDQAKEFKGTSGKVGHEKEAGIHRYFHCELQMLDKFLTSTDVYEYFGCSKLSCYLCWCVLVGSNTKYRTNYTHRKIGTNSAFLFKNSEDRTEGFLSVAKALKSVEDHLRAYIARKALSGHDYYLTTNEAVSDTRVAYTAADRGRRVEESEDEESDEERVRSSGAESLWSPVHDMVNGGVWDGNNSVLTRLEQRNYEVVWIPTVGDPQLISATAYNMYKWGPRDSRGTKLPPLPVVQNSQETWYLDYLFRAHANWDRGRGSWSRYKIADNYYADMFKMNPIEQKKAGMSGVRNGWWDGETQGKDPTYYFPVEIYVVALKSCERVGVDGVSRQCLDISSVDLQPAIAAIKVYVQELFYTPRAKNQLPDWKELKVNDQPRLL
jgi:hypothetical protein